MGSATVATEHRATATMMLLNIFLLFLPFLVCRPTINDGRNLSRFQVAVQHCCSSRTSKTPHRCFELNEFSGINFVASPCRFLKTLEKTVSPVEPSDEIASAGLEPSDGIALADVEPSDEIALADLEPSDGIALPDVEPSDEIDLSDLEPSDEIDLSDLEPSYEIDFSDDQMVLSDIEPAVEIISKSIPPKPKDKAAMSKFQSAVKNCCSNSNSKTAYRCFEVNGIDGVNFVEKPCMFLHTLKDMFEEEEAN